MAMTVAPSLLVLSVVLVTMGGSAEAIDSVTGTCPAKEHLSFFNPNVFKGEWYEYGHFFPIFDNINRCTKFRFSDPTHGVMALELSGKTAAGFRSAPISGTASVAGSNGVLSVKFPFLIPHPTNYSILGTDYASWAVLWTCQETVTGNSQNVIVLTRQQSPYQFSIDSALRTIDSKNISRFNFKQVAQNFC